MKFDDENDTNVADDRTVAEPVLLQSWRSVAVIRRAPGLGPVAPPVAMLSSCAEQTDRDVVPSVNPKPQW
jgi:hypothetical protein